MQLDHADKALLHWIDRAFGAERPARIGVAVSGGGDSMALLHLYMRWAQQSGVPIAAVTVDHSLREGSAAEAAKVACFCAEHGIAHETLVWDNWDGHGNLQAAARDARYWMIAAWALANDIDGIALGHTKDDSVETFLMRLARKAGIDGLALMESQFTREGLRWARPLWLATRADLRSYLARHDVDWIDDPSNDDVDFERVRVRQALVALSDLGVSQDALHQTAHHAAQARDALDHYTRIEAGLHITQVGGDLILPAKPDLPAEMIRRLWTKAVQWVGRLDYPPRATSIRHLQGGLALDGKATAGGCLAITEGGQVRITREHQAVKMMTGATHLPWDKHWQLEGPHAKDLHVAALGEAVKDCPDWRETGLPRASLMATPAVWRGDMLIAAPLAGDSRGWTAQIVADFHSSLLTH
ncbi:tRNA(Ile)-lysidine synthase [Cognatiyoonia koreensis]|uniref:tRNA(Ile)-lysidine synthase n=1 Tax=Cognatiyoonia koreensis TaxID=364200 RepID=A0A1I0MLM1_9RHOB|nr:tRNA lysidine(34) synthetase TilS [Cognatiyoonia koreensis]SEV89374.1 tRNA(Ile)-lysidine synthase [Cognatiyoonia koreensis]